MVATSGLSFRKIASEQHRGGWEWIQLGSVSPGSSPYGKPRSDRISQSRSLQAHVYSYKNSFSLQSKSFLLFPLYWISWVKSVIYDAIWSSLGLEISTFFFPDPGFKPCNLVFTSFFLRLMKSFSIYRSPIIMSSLSDTPHVWVLREGLLLW